MISILLTFLLMIISLGRLFLLRGEICLIGKEEIDDLESIKYNLKNALSRWAVKFVVRVNDLLNYIVLVVAQKATQTTLIQSQNLKFEG